MERKPKLDFDVVTLEQQDSVELLVRVAAPATRDPRNAAGRHLQVVLDVGETMHPKKLFPALRGIDQVVSRLSDDDTFGLVTFGLSNEVAFPAGPVGDGSAVEEVLGEIRPIGLADPTAGLLLGIRECQRIGARRSAVVMISDADLSAGDRRESQVIVGMAGGAREQGFPVSTISMGPRPGNLLRQISRHGGGRAHLAGDGSAVAGVLAGVLPGLLDRPIRALSLSVRTSIEVEQFSLSGDWPVLDLDGETTLELGDLRAGESVGTTVRLRVSGLGDIGHLEIAELELEWTDVTTKCTQSALAPIWVNLPEGASGCGEIAYQTKLDFELARDMLPDTAEDMKEDGARPRRTRRPTSRPIPPTLEARVEELVRERTAIEVERQLRELKPDDEPDPQNPAQDAEEHEGADSDPSRNERPGPLDSSE